MIAHREGAVMNDDGITKRAQRELRSESHATATEKRKKIAKVAGLIVFLFASISWLAKVFSIPTKDFVASLEIGGLVLLPLMLFYARSNWPRRLWVAYAVVLPLLWFCTYSVLHELSHLAGVLLIGDKIVEHHLMPHFWQGEFTVGWVRSQALHERSWRDVLPGYGPYIRDILLLSIALIWLKGKRIQNPLLAGLVLVFFGLSSLFDIVDNYINGYVIGRMPGNDFMGSAIRIGSTWTNVIGVTATAFAAYVVWKVVRRSKGFPVETLQL